MKKIISFILIAILCLGVLTSCDIIDSIKDKIGFGDQVDDAAADKAFNDAVMSLHRMYKDKAESTSVDFDLVSQVIVNGVKYPVTWTVDNEKVSIRESVNAGFYTVDLPDVNEEEFTYTITATITDGGERSEQKSYTFKMLVLDNSSVDTELKEGVAYKMFLVQGTFGQRMYALNTMQMGTGDGANYGKYIKTTLDPKAGADYYAEIVDGGYKWYTNIDGVKHYVFAQTLFESEDKKAENKFSKYIGLSTENASVFSYNAEMGGVWTVLIEGNTFGVGTYSDFKTICISEGSFFSTDVIGVSQFVLQFMTTEYANTLTPDEEQKINEPENNSTLTIPEINEHASQRPHNNYTDGKFYVTGTIDSVSNNQYGNLIIKDAEGNTLTIYGSYDATGANRYDAMANAPVVGDEVTLYGVIGNYNGTVQMKNAWIIAINGENQGDTPSTPSDRTFTLATELKTGDQVVIGAPAHGKLFSSTKTGYYNVGIDYSATNFANVTDAEIWVVTVNEDGSYTFTSLTTGKPIAMADSYSSFNEDGANKSWALVAKEGAEGIFYVKNTVRGNYIEWYADKDNWSSYATSELSDLFELSFYVVAGGTDTPVDPAPHEHKYVDGKCECGAEDPNYVAPETPSAGVEAGKAYIITANNVNGPIYLSNSVSSGRFVAVTNIADATVYYVESATAGFLVYFLDGETKNYVVMADKSAGGSFVTDAASATVFEWNATLNTLEVVDDDNARGFGADPSKDYVNFSCYAVSNGTTYSWGQFVAAGSTDTPVDPEPEVCEHNYVDGVCSLCGESDPDYVAPEAPSAGIEVGKGYTISASNGNGVLYATGGVTGGRFDGTLDASAATTFYVEAGANSGEYLLYFYNADVKTYIVMGDSSTGGSTATDDDSATVFDWNDTIKTLVVAEDSNNRAFGCQPTSTYNNFSSYDASNSYNWGQFVVVE
ncbi:MAG: hypothetical protein IJX58_03365 [Clostridia bacterium]|nr:hypothetical protein [Clostridia bacterium]